MKIVEEINPENWHYYGQWEQPPFSASFWVHWYDKDICQELDLAIPQGKNIMINGHTIVFKEDFKYLKNRLIQAHRDNDKEFFNKIKKVSLKILENHKKLTSTLENNEETNLELFNKFIDSSKRVMVPWFIMVVYSDFIGEILAKEVKKFKINSKDIINFIPEIKSLMIKQQREALKIKKDLEKNELLNLIQKKPINEIIEKIKKDKELWNKVENHIDEYEWIGTHHFWGESLTLEKFLKNIASLKHKKENKINKKLPQELRFLIKIISEFGYLRNYSAEIFDLVALKAKPFLKNIGKELELSYEELLLFTPIEVVSFLNKNSKPSKEVINKRKNGFVILLNNGREKVIDNNIEINIFKKEFVPHESVSGDQFKGEVASKGYVKGKVKVFLVPENFSKMEEGDILVTTMTTPDFIPIMQRASAIVTDIGGLLSHAAVVSREMNKPCIVGIKAATRTLKDGDLVEVNANKGIVKKL